MAASGLKTHFNVPVAEYELRRGGHLGRRRRLLVEEELTKSTRPGATVLEIGCGPGLLLSDLARAHPDRQFVGLDRDERMVAHAREHHAGDNVRYELVDLARERPNVEAAFAYSVDLLHHRHELDPFLSALGAAGLPGGTWLAVGPNIFHPYILWSQARMKRAGFDEDHFRPWAVEPHLERAGFEVAARRYAFLFPGWIERVPAPVAWLEPLLERFRILGGSVVYRLVRR